MYVLLGSNGNITSKTAQLLLSRGQRVRVVGRNAEKLEPLWLAGAELAIGDMADVDFLSHAMGGADAVYTMIPTAYNTADPVVTFERIGEAIAQAVARAGVKRVVNLSRAGAHLERGTGLIVSLNAQEERLNRIAGVKTLHLRPSYFFDNYFTALKLFNVYGAYSDLVAPDLSIPAIATIDIAAVVARELMRSSQHADKQVLHLRGPQALSPGEAAATLGKAIGKPEFAYAQAEPAWAIAAMLRHGVSPAMVDLIVAMNKAFSRADFFSPVHTGPTEITPTSLEQFASGIRPAIAGFAGGWRMRQNHSQAFAWA
jgi:uncharacterized protein YbjT (DUF2867 family)